MEIIEYVAANALDYVEENVLYSAQLFLDGDQDWNQDSIVSNVCNVCDFDEDFVWLASRVLFEDAVRFLLIKPYRYGPDAEYL